MGQKEQNPGQPPPLIPPELRAFHFGFLAYFLSI
jgi:hypothetical protein